MKVHLAKRFSGNRVSLNRSECGRHYSGVSQSIMIAKTGVFNETYKENKESVCIKCLGIAKEQNRIK